MEKLTWQLINTTNEFLLCTNERAEKRTKPLEGEKLQRFYYNHRKFLIPGQLVFTEKGYGVIQTKSDNNQVKIKLNNGKSKEFKINKIRYKIQLRLGIFFEEIKSKKIIHIWANATQSDIIAKITEILKSTVESEGLLTTVYFRGKVLESTGELMHKSGITNKTKLLVVISKGQYYSINRFDKEQTGWSYGETYYEAIAFKVSQPVKLVGIGIYTAERTDYNEESEEEVESRNQPYGNLKLMRGHGQNCPVIIQQNIKCQVDMTYHEGKIYKFLYARAIPLKPQQTYSLYIQLLGNSSLYGQQGKEYVQGDDGTQFQFVNIEGSDTNITDGQFPEIYYMS